MPVVAVRNLQITDLLQKTTCMKECLEVKIDQYKFSDYILSGKLSVNVWMSRFCFAKTTPHI